MKQLKTWEFIYNSLQQNIAVMLLYVLESQGSSPGRQGFLMAVNADDEMSGSVGGGMMEHKFIEMAKKELVRSRDPIAIGSGTVRKQIHDKSAAKNQSGMICSGEQTIFLYPVSVIDKETIANIISSLRENKNGLLTLSPGGIAFSTEAPAKDYDYSFESGENWQYKEKTGYKNQLFIIGGGHCALAFSKLMSQMDFYIRLFDERSNLNTLEQNEFVHEKLIVNDYAELASLITPGNNHYVVIMTFGYRSDDMAVRALINKEFAYLGILGSHTKIEKMMDQFHSEEINPSWLERIYAPIGLAIKSQTPEEIAVSIAGEIIHTKNRHTH